jgi:hypothetical protein
MANMAKCSKLGEIIPKTMEQRFKSLSLFEFQERFSNAADCLKYLADEKWGNGFVCRKCGHTHSCAGKATQSRQCTCCRYVESPTAQTLFHKVKFDLLKAFYIVYFVSTNKKGITSTELSRKLNLRQKTCWGFKRKVMKAMESSENHPIEGDVEVDETVFGGQEENTKGRKNINKKLVVLAIEKKNKGVSRLYARVIPNASAEQLGGFMKAHIDPKAKITTDKWTGYIPLKADFENLTRVASGKKGSNFPELHRVVMNLKSWLRGVHHHVNDLQDYLNEYCYRFNRSFMKECLFHLKSIPGFQFKSIPLLIKKQYLKKKGVPLSSSNCWRPDLHISFFYFFISALVSLNLKDSPFMLMIYALWVSLSTNAEVRTGSPNNSLHRSKDKFVVIIVDFLPALNERCVKSISAPCLSKET